MPKVRREGHQGRLLTLVASWGADRAYPQDVHGHVAGETRPQRLRIGPRTALVALVIVGLAIAGASIWRAGRSPLPASTHPAATPRQYFVKLEQTAVASTPDGANVMVTIRGATNLPDGTIAGVLWTSVGHGGDSTGGSPFFDGLPLSSVHDGVLSIVIEPGCTGLGKGFDVDVEISPVFHNLLPPNDPSSFQWPPRQPRAVLQALGAKFQRLSGEQVSVMGSPGGAIHRIVLNGYYAWPTGPQSFVSRGCPFPGT